MDVREIRDVWEAYEFMTGKKPLHGVPATDTEMELTPELRASVRARILSWKGQIAGERPLISKRYKDLQPMLRQFGKKGEGQQLDAGLNDLFNRVQQAYRNGEGWGKDHPGAHLYFIQSALFFKLLAHELEFLNAALRLDLDAISSQLQSEMGVKGRVEALAMEMKVQAGRSSIGGRISAEDGFAAYGDATAMVYLAEQEIRQAAGIVEKVQRARKQISDEEATGMLLRLLIKPLSYYVITDFSLDYARDVISFGSEEGSRSSVELNDAENLGKAYASAAGAALKYFDALVTSERATQAGISIQAASEQLSQQEFELPILRILCQQTEGARELFPEDPTQTKLVQLAFGARAYLGAAGLINKYYCLGATLNEKGEANLHNREALRYQIEAARRRAAEAAGRSMTLAGLIPASARLEYQRASALAMGSSDDEKLLALRSYWTSTFWSNLAVQFATR